MKQIYFETVWQVLVPVHKITKVDNDRDLLGMWYKAIVQKDAGAYHKGEEILTHGGQLVHKAGTKNGFIMVRQANLNKL